MMGLQLPALRAAWAHATQGMLLVQKNKLKEARELFARAGREHPDAFFAFLEASCWMTTHDNSPAQKMEYFRRAVDVFGTAISRASLVRGVERAARFLRMRCRCELIRYDNSNPEEASVPGDPEIRRHLDVNFIGGAMDDIRWFGSHPDFTEYELSIVCEESNNLGNGIEGLALAGRWVKHKPDSLLGWHQKARMAYFTGAWRVAHDSAKRVLELNPKHAEAQRILERSVEKAREWAAAQEVPAAPKQN
ncbi:MAG: hypothetical protein IPK72_22080 [Candidatus Eisenbacteria bacterium]|nr:hypothetical protein [Candidatus Eisenbacteria bacterium]